MTALEFSAFLYELIEQLSEVYDVESDLSTVGRRLDATRLRARIAGQYALDVEWCGADDMSWSVSWDKAPVRLVVSTEKYGGTGWKTRLRDAIFDGIGRAFERAHELVAEADREEGVRRQNAVAPTGPSGTTLAYQNLNNALLDDTDPPDEK